MELVTAVVAIITSVKIQHHEDIKKN